MNVGVVLDCRSAVVRGVLGWCIPHRGGDVMTRDEAAKILGTKGRPIGKDMETPIYTRHEAYELVDAYVALGMLKLDKPQDDTEYVVGFLHDVKVEVGERDSYKPDYVGWLTKNSLRLLIQALNDRGFKIVRETP